MGFCRSGDWAQLRIQHGQMGMYSQRVGRGAMDGKSLRGSIRSKGGVLAKATSQDSC